MRNYHRISPIGRMLARTLTWGVWISAGVILAGLAMNLRRNLPASQAEAGIHVVNSGIALLILLPAFRVVLMFGAFVRTCEYRLAACAAVVLIVIVAGFALGLRMARVNDGTRKFRPFYGARAATADRIDLARRRR